MTDRKILLCEVRDGRIAELTVYCSGDWDAELPPATPPKPRSYVADRPAPAGRRRCWRSGRRSGSLQGVGVA